MAIGQSDRRAVLTSFVQAMVERGIFTDQFLRLRELQLNGENPAFMSELVELYVRETAERLEVIKSLVDAQQPDFLELSRRVHQFMGTCATFGARRMTDATADLLSQCKGHNVGGCRAMLLHIRQHFGVLKRVLGVYKALDTSKTQNVHQVRTCGRCTGRWASGGPGLASGEFFLCWNSVRRLER